jgi:hypothetical protein
MGTVGRSAIRASCHNYTWGHYIFCGLRCSYAYDVSTTVGGLVYAAKKM